MTPTQAKLKAAENLKSLKSKAESLAQQNRAKVMAAPHFFELDKRERALVLNISKNEFLGNKNDKLIAELEEIKNKKAEILVSLGLTKDDLVASYNCPTCHDTGYFEGKQCACLTKQILSILSNNQSLETFDNFNFKRDSVDNTKYVEKAVRFGKSWANGEQPFLNILINGQVGTGKTFLGECLLSECSNHGAVVYKISAFAMNELFTKFHTTFDYSKQDYLTELLDCDVLMIDDLGTEPIKRNVTLEYLLLILSERENANKKTIITTNLNPDQIRDVYQERIFSRLSCKTKTATIRLTGDDLRLN